MDGFQVRKESVGSWWRQQGWTGANRLYNFIGTLLRVCKMLSVSHTVRMCSDSMSIPSTNKPQNGINERRRITIEEPISIEEPMLPLIWKTLIKPKAHRNMYGSRFLVRQFVLSLSPTFHEFLFHRFMFSHLARSSVKSWLRNLAPRITFTFNWRVHWPNFVSALLFTLREFVVFKRRCVK